MIPQYEEIDMTEQTTNFALHAKGRRLSGARLTETNPF